MGKKRKNKKFYIFKLVFNGIWLPIKAIINIFARAIIYCTKKNPVLATGFIAFSFAFTLVACNALFVQEIKADTVNTNQKIVVTDVASDSTKAQIVKQPTAKIKPKKHVAKLNNYATRKALHAVLRLSRKQAKKLMRQTRKKAKLH